MFLGFVAEENRLRTMQSVVRLFPFAATANKTSFLCRKETLAESTSIALDTLLRLLPIAAYQHSTLSAAENLR
jgi:hypothetical protein